MEGNDILNENQAGFRKNYSTVDHIFVLNSVIELLRYQQKKLFCAYIDFSQAFDNVWRIGLWRKLLHTEVKGKFFRVIYNMYSDIKSCVSVKDERSVFFFQTNKNDNKRSAGHYCAIIGIILYFYGPRKTLVIPKNRVIRFEVLNHQ